VRAHRDVSHAQLVTLSMLLLLLLLLPPPPLHCRHRASTHARRRRLLSHEIRAARVTRAARIRARDCVSRRTSNAVSSALATSVGGVDVGRCFFSTTCATRASFNDKPIDHVMPLPRTPTKARRQATSVSHALSRMHELARALTQHAHACGVADIVRECVNGAVNTRNKQWHVVGVRTAKYELHVRRREL
jgi:hypothetical protein